MKSKLRSGITTGACAAGAAKAALLTCLGSPTSVVTISNQQGQLISVPIKETECHQLHQSASAIVVKDGGDDPDATHGLDIVVHLQLNDNGVVDIQGGNGVGRATKPGLLIEVGQWAINPVPRQMILQALREILPNGHGATVTIEVPGGDKVAQKTLNPKLGIVGGISILGTTGIVRPMSQEAFQDSLIPQLGIAKAHGLDTVVLTPGHMGERFAIEDYGFPKEAVIQMSNFVGFMLQACVDKQITKVLLWGHHGKLVKVAGGSFNTHSKIADGRRETIAAHAVLMGADATMVREILVSNTAEEAAYILKEHALLDATFASIAKQTSYRASQYVNNELQVGTVLLSLKGEILAVDETGHQIGCELGWKPLK